VQRSTITLLITLTVLAAAGCGAGGGSSHGETLTGRDEPAVLSVAAAESFWGDIAAQLGGSKVEVSSIISNPAQDPHSYQPTAADARTLAASALAIYNGIGYDPWVNHLLAADPESGRIALDVGRLLGLNTGDNPHRWYDPSNVETVANAITAALKRLDPRDARYFDGQRTAFEGDGLGPYHAAIASIRKHYSGVPVGASESIFAPMAPALGLGLLTPTSFMKAISEGTEVTAQDAIATQRQITSHEIKVWIYNSQNATPQVQRLTSLARQNAIPVVTVTETLTPPTASFQHWQTAQLQQLARALHEATGR
jgi:zinc/manganese transport system substrate-binding protein